MGNRIGGAVRDTRSAVHSGLDKFGGWGQSMDDRFERFSGDFRRRVGRRMGNGGRGGRRDWDYSQGGSWRNA